jgi:hypothetical protein
MQSRGLRAFAIVFLTLEGAGTVAWWLVLLAFPSARRPFLAEGAPDSTLLAFLLPDSVLFAGAALLAALAIAKDRPWSTGVLWLHAGASAYAGLYGIGLFALSPNAWLGAALMLGPLVIDPYLAWRLSAR